MIMTKPMTGSIARANHSPMRDNRMSARATKMVSSRACSALEGLRRAGIVEPIDADYWRIAADYADPGL